MRSFLEDLTPIGLAPEVVTVGSYPTARFLNDPNEGLLVDLDRTHPNLVFYAANQIRLVRSGHTLISEPLSPHSLSRWIRQTMAGHEKSAATAFNPQSIFITGSGLDGNQFEQELSQHLGLPVKRADLVRMTDGVVKNEPTQPWEPHLMDNALALALSEASGSELFNFRRGPFSITKHWVENKKSLITTGILLALVLILALTGIILDTVYLQKRVSALDQEIHGIFRSSFPDVKNIVDPLHQMQLGIDDAKKTFLVSGESLGPVGKLDILNDISRLIPDKVDVEIDSIVMGEDNVVLSGDTDTFNSVDEIKSSLEQSKLFKSVTISSANLNRTGDRVRFKLKVQL
jgi:Tfp pilus assembly protein PilN